MSVRPNITSISPSRALFGTVVDADIRGNGFGSNPSVNAGSDISVSIQGATNTEIVCTFTLAGNGTGGAHGVTVTASGQTSSSVNFYVQIPTSLRRDSISSTTPIDPGPGDIVNAFGQTVATGKCGAYLNLVYTLMDQDGPAQPIDTDQPITETFSNYSGPPAYGIATETQTLTQGRFGDTIAIVLDAPSCPPAGTSASVTQNFSVAVGLNVFSLATANTIVRSKSTSGTYTITVSSQ
jgi:hypothetical protein